MMPAARRARSAARVVQEAAPAAAMAERQLGTSWPGGLAHMADIYLAASLDDTCAEEM